jgi:hypothetical protein
MAEPLSDARLAEIREMWLEPDALRAIWDLLSEVDRRRAAPCPRVITSDDGTSWCDLAANVPDLRQDLEGWQRTAAQLTTALRDHVFNWGRCADACGNCSHCRAVALLVREGALDDPDEDPEPDETEAGRLLNAITAFLKPMRCPPTPNTASGMHCAECCYGTGWADVHSNAELEVAQALEHARALLRLSIGNGGQS